jgi:hypothetical protein
MNCQEFNIEFDILYNNVSSGQAPGLNGYEKSIYLTLAQEELVKTAYSGYNPTKESVEETEKRRKQLSQLITNLKVDVSSMLEDNTDNMITDTANSLISYMVPISSDVWFQLYESVTFKDLNQNCKYDGKTAWVMVMSHDDYSLSSINPFRIPNFRKVWRVDYKDITASLPNKKVIELVTAYPIATYHTRYLRKPKPIILEDLSSYGQNLTIDGAVKPYSRPTGTVLLTDECCELNQVFHRDILNRAVELAYRDYNEKNLQTLIQTNQRMQ